MFAIENVMHTLILLQVRWYIYKCHFSLKKSIQYVQNQKNHLSIDLELEMIVYNIVITLALGSQPRQRGCKVVGQEEARKSHHILPKV